MQGHGVVPKWQVLIIVVAFLWATIVWSGQARPAPPTIVTTFTILQDFAKQIAGPDSDVRTLSPVGAEVHEWELTPHNLVDLNDADVVFYNGLNTEQWMHLIEDSVRPGVRTVAVATSSQHPTLPIKIGDFAGDPDPHIWMDPRGAAAYVRTIRDILMELDPSRAWQYERNAKAYLDDLALLHRELSKMTARIPVEYRTLISSEAAFVYFAHTYGFYHEGIWGTNTEQEGTPQQMVRVLEVIMERTPPAIFWESTGSPRYAESISADTGVPVFGPLYVDSVGKPQSHAETYVAMMKANARLLVHALNPEQP